MTDKSKKKDKKNLPDTVNKHSASIQISGHNITLMQRKAYNILLANAYKELPLKEKHTIRIWDILSCTGWNDTKNLKEALKALAEIVVEWNILNKDNKNEWGVASLLAEAIITDENTLTYVYSPTMREKLYNPSTYARINLEIQKKFTSKYSLALYELACDYFIRNRGRGETPWIPIQEFRKIMGCVNEYENYKEISRYVIQRSIKEINEKSDLLVTYATQNDKGKGRRVIAIKFVIEANENKASFIRELYGPKQEELNLDGELAQRLIEDFCLTRRQVYEILEMDPEYVNECLEHIHKDYAADPTHIRNLGGYTYKFIKENFLPKNAKNKLDAGTSKEKLKVWNPERFMQDPPIMESKEEIPTTEEISGWQIKCGLQDDQVKDLNKIFKTDIDKCGIPLELEFNDPEIRLLYKEWINTGQLARTYRKIAKGNAPPFP